jgi:hypothetical protein
VKGSASAIGIKKAAKLTSVALQAERGGGILRVIECQKSTFSLALENDHIAYLERSATTQRQFEMMSQV